jgi:hypothetical protein
MRKLLSKRLFGRLPMRWQDNIKMGCRETDIEGGTWIEQAEDHVQYWNFSGVEILSSNRKVDQSVLVT